MRRLYFILSIFVTTCFNVKAQNITCQELFETITENYDTKDNINCFGSSALIKITYYRLNNTGFAVAYIKKNDYDYKGQPYVFCGISQQLWSSFKAEGLVGSWGKAFNEYIMDNKCNCG